MYRHPGMRQAGRRPRTGRPRRSSTAVESARLGNCPSVIGVAVVQECDEKAAVSEGVCGHSRLSNIFSCWRRGLREVLLPNRSDGRWLEARAGIDLPSARVADSRSRITSDFVTLRARDSASIWATSASGNRTVRVFIRAIVLRDWQRRNTALGSRAASAMGRTAMSDSFRPPHHLRALLRPAAGGDRGGARLAGRAPAMR